MTDEQRINSIKAILQKQRHPEHRDMGDKGDILIKRTKNYPGISDTSTNYERFFAISGEDVYKSGCQWSCGTEAKTFCYLNSTLPKNERLEVKIMISTHLDHLIDSMANHTLPCVKMGDGKWYPIEPQPDIIEKRPRHPMYPDMPFIMDEIKVGNTIHHILKNIAEHDRKPYEITAIMSWPEYEKKCSDFGTFLKYGSKRDRKTKVRVTRIENVLKRLNNGKSMGRPYSFCKLMQGSTLPIKVIQTIDNTSQQMLIEINREAYIFSPNRRYLMLRKLDQETTKKWTMSDYIKWFEKNIINKSAKDASNQ